MCDIRVKIVSIVPTVSIVQRIAPPGSWPKLLIFRKKWFVFFMNELTFLPIGCKWWSRNGEVFHVHNPQFEITKIH